MPDQIHKSNIDHNRRGITEFLIRQNRLPHWQCPESLYFITFNTHNRRILSPESRTIVIEALKFWDKVRLDLFHAVVMPDHVHVLLRPLEKSESVFWDLAEIVQSIKGFSARAINKIENTTGAKVWQKETYDRIVRDYEECVDTICYISQNPIKAMLVEKSEDYPWLFHRQE